MKENISTLEGKTLDFISTNYMGGMRCPVVVAIAEDDIGYTVTDVDDKDDHYICYHGPVSTYPRMQVEPEEWEKAKEYLFIAVEQGYYDAQESDMFVYGRLCDSVGSGAMGACSFS